MAKDILLNPETMDLDVSQDGDFKVADSTSQEIDLLLKTHRGHWRQHPLAGIGMDDFMNSPFDLAQIRKEVAAGLRHDDMKEIRVLLTPNGLSVDAQRDE